MDGDAFAFFILYLLHPFFVGLSVSYCTSSR